MRALTEQLIESGDWYSDFKSTNVSAARYSVDQSVLEIKFNNGDVYDYHGVPEDVFDSFVSASSKGAFCWTWLRGHYRYEQVSGTSKWAGGTKKGAKKGKEGLLPVVDQSQRRKVDQAYDKYRASGSQEDLNKYIQEVAKREKNVKRTINPLDKRYKPAHQIHGRKKLPFK